MSPNARVSAFTLIELSIVLVIVGLLVGSVIVGRDMIASAESRALIAQIEKYRTAVNTFRQKYDALPGDINATKANAAGLAARGPFAGQGDGNGSMQGNWGYPTGCAGCNYGNGFTGENAMIWHDLTYANGQNLGLIDGMFSTATSTALPGGSGSTLDLYMPSARLGKGLRVVTMNMGTYNYFVVAAITGMTLNWCTGCLEANPGIPVLTAYNIDTKLDDGLPQSGAVIAEIPGGYFVSAAGVNNWTDGVTHTASGTTATTGSSTTCYDNGGVSGTQYYSTSQSGGANTNCALAFRF